MVRHDLTRGMFLPIIFILIDLNEMEDLNFTISVLIFGLSVNINFLVFNLR